jgi:starvation-inducible DNA-binding protein
MKATAMNVHKAMGLRTAPLQTPTDLKAEGVREITGALNVLLADVFALYLKTKNFHWHISGPHFRDYHLLLDEHGDQIFAVTYAIAERVRKIGGTTLRSIGEISRLQSIQDNDAEFVIPQHMLAELRDDNKDLAPPKCGRPMGCARNTTTWPRQAYWKSGSTTPRGAPGSCLRQAAPPSRVESILAIRTRLHQRSRS